MRRLVAFLVLALASLLVVANCRDESFGPSRRELLRNPKFVESATPRFETITPESLREAVKVSSRRNYAMLGFNEPSITVWLPPLTNSIYSRVDFDKPKVTDAQGRDVPVAIDLGILDFDTWSNEIRFTKENGTVDFAHAVGNIKVKYPLGFKTSAYQKGTSADVSIDGPFVTYNSAAISPPKEASFSKIRSLRAYDSLGRELKPTDLWSERRKGAVSWRQVSFWGEVAAVQIDRATQWATLSIDYDLASPPPLPDAQRGRKPSLAERMKAKDSGGGTVTKTVVVETPNTPPV